MTGTIKALDEKNFYLIQLGKSLTLANLEKIKKVVQQGLQQKHKTLLFNLKNTHVLDSRGVGFIANLYKQLKNEGGAICIVSPQPHVMNVLQSCGLHNMLDIYDTMEEARKAFTTGINIETKGFYAMLTLTEKLDLDVIAPVRTELNKTIADGYRHFIIDLKSTHLVTSVGIGMLLNLYKKLKEMKGDIYLLNVSPEIRTLLDTTNVLKVISEYNTLEEIEEKIL